MQTPPFVAIVFLNNRFDFCSIFIIQFDGKYGLNGFFWFINYIWNFLVYLHVYLMPLASQNLNVYVCVWVAIQSLLSPKLLCLNDNYIICLCWKLWIWMLYLDQVGSKERRNNCKCGCVALPLEWAITIAKYSLLLLSLVIRISLYSRETCYSQKDC